MKKISLCIITFLFCISTTNSSQALSLDELLQIPTGPEVFDIQRATLDNHRFASSTLETVYNNYRTLDNILRTEIIRKYEAGDFENTQMQGIVRNYKNFVFHTNKLFAYLALKDNGIRGKSIDTAILRSYQNIRINFDRMTDIIR